MNLIVPMAGRGTRMRPSTLTIPKPLFPIADKSIVEWLVYEISKSTNRAIDEIGFIIHPDFGKQIEQDLMQIASKYHCKGKIYYQEQALGTAHAILCAQESLKGNVLIAFADTLFKAKFDIDINKDGIIWTKAVENPQQYGVVVTDENKKILYFEEKPLKPVSNEAIIGIYFFKDGEYLKKELQYLLDNDLKEKGEYQLTNAMENMRQKGLDLYSQTVEKWLDCGNKSTTLYSHQEVLKSNAFVEHLNNNIINSKIIPPCYIASDVIIENSQIGPYVSIGEGSVLKNTQIKDSILMKNIFIENIQMHQSIIGNCAQIKSKNYSPLMNVHISDYSNIELD